MELNAVSHYIPFLIERTVRKVGSSGEHVSRHLKSRSASGNRAGAGGQEPGKAETSKGQAPRGDGKGGDETFHSLGARQRPGCSCAGTCAERGAFPSGFGAPESESIIARATPMAAEFPQSALARKSQRLASLSRVAPISSGGCGGAVQCCDDAV